jgi:hypothetical protein
MGDDLQVLDVQEETRRCAPHVRRLRFFAGIALMAFSFLVYPAYPLIVFLPLPGDVKLSGMVAASLLSWGIFSTGTFLAGREGYDWLKGLCRR